MVRALLVAMVVCVALPSSVLAQTAPPVQITDPDADLAVVLAEPDFTLAALPGALRTPAGKWVFRLTHRFTRPIDAGSAGDFFSSLFGFDGGAKIGLEFRYGLRPGADITFHRTSDRTIQLLGRYALTAPESKGLSFTLLGGIDGRNNLGISEELDLEGSDLWTGAIGAVISRRFNDCGAVYIEPMAVINASVSPLEDEGEQHTFMLGLGIRWRLGQSRTYIVVEAAPRVPEIGPRPPHVSFAIETRAGGHMFQLNVGNSLATTIGQIARGGSENDDWYIGFNLTRKFW